ncbi:MAG: hypothetical protein EOO90_24145 [Pedobacter sp.]|nr:MAG: hypothetical protein EOO90_24145 [Pedobacter sp.]
MQNLKKMLPLMALVLGMGLVLTQSAFKTTKTDQYTFRYNGPNYSQANVENEANWIHDESVACTDVPQKACSIKVDASFVNNPLTTPTLKSSLNLATDLYSGTAFVEGSDDGSMEIINRQQ